MPYQTLIFPAANSSLCTGICHRYENDVSALGGSSRGCNRMLAVLRNGSNHRQTGNGQTGKRHKKSKKKSKKNKNGDNNGGNAGSNGTTGGDGTTQPQ